MSRRRYAGSTCYAIRMFLPYTVVLCGCLWAPSCKELEDSPRIGEAELFRTTGWEDYAYTGQGLMLRHDGRDSGSVLLTMIVPPDEYRRVESGKLHEDSSEGAVGTDTRSQADDAALQAFLPVYRLDPRTQRLESVSIDEWETAWGEVVVCVEQSGSAPNTWKHDRAKWKIVDDKGVVVRTHGEHALGIDFSPSGTFASVVSGNGSKTGGMFFGRGVNGPLFHEVFRVGSGSRVGKPVRFPDGAAGMGAQCWTPDESFVIYSDGYIGHLAVFATNSNTSEQQRR